MKTRQAFGEALAALVTTTSLLTAQVPTPPGLPGGGAPAVAPTAAPTAAPGASAAPQGNLRSYLLPTQEQCDKCKQTFCNSNSGKLTRSSK